MNDHRWSGWPGAWCLDCGIPDPIEECVANCDADMLCITCQERWPQSDICTNGKEHIVEIVACPKHVMGPCSEPMSHNHDPYYHAEVG